MELLTMVDAWANVEEAGRSKGVKTTPACQMMYWKLIKLAVQEGKLLENGDLILDLSLAKIAAKTNTPFSTVAASIRNLAAAGIIERIHGENTRQGCSTVLYQRYWRRDTNG